MRTKNTIIKQYVNLQKVRPVKPRSERHFKNYEFHKIICNVYYISDHIFFIFKSAFYFKGLDYKYKYKEVDQRFEAFVSNRSLYKIM